MEKRKSYSIWKLQNEFGFDYQKTDYFYVEFGKDLLYFDEPFRTETFAILFLKEGILDLSTDLHRQEIAAPAVVTVSPEVARKIHQSDPRPLAEVLFFTDTFLLETHVNIFYLDRYHFFFDTELHVLKLGPENFKRLEAVFSLIKQNFNQEHPNERYLIRACTHMLIAEIDAFHKHCETVNPAGNRSGSLFVKFRNLLGKNFWRHRSVNYYANNLNVTPKYLSEVVKRDTGQTAGEWINKAIVLEAKLLLQKKDLNVAQVSDKLNFSDQSVFGKFFKTHTGFSPVEYRKKLNE